MMDNRIKAFCDYLDHSHSAYHAQANLVEILKLSLIHISEPTRRS